jgi:hypothetical protein
MTQSLAEGYLGGLCAQPKYLVDPEDAAAGDCQLTALLAAEQQIILLPLLRSPPPLLQLFPLFFLLFLQLRPPFCSSFLSSSFYGMED